MLSFMLIGKLQFWLSDEGADLDFISDLPARRAEVLAINGNWAPAAADLARSSGIFRCDHNCRL
jgi:hypothetical protein